MYTKQLTCSRVGATSAAVLEPINKSKKFPFIDQLKKDIKEFGKKNFVKEILWQTEDFDELQEMEVRIIKQVNATKDKAWYNVHERYGYH